MSEVDKFWGGGLKTSDKGSKKIESMVCDHTPLTPPPEAHLWSPYCKKKICRNGTYNIKNGFLLNKEIYKYAS